MLVMLGVGALAVAWGFCVVLVFGLVSITVRPYCTTPMDSVKMMALGVGIAIVLSLAPIVIVVFLRVN